MCWCTARNILRSPVRGDRNSISKIQQAAVVQTIDQFPPLFGQLFEQLIEYFFGAQFPLLNQEDVQILLLIRCNYLVCSSAFCLQLKASVTQCFRVCRTFSRRSAFVIS
ncbi:Hypothetical_protein [Hexamita inflata]|uniref:Hypothetical_protein n=1 Tax=Hexamita inflata TaxID=28002 RepID=A0AA86P5R6_9EUKA|nr:Hypothetical protein HINF_LOCUS19580 [Hexamita inflata]